MKIFLTGATGFLGNELLKALAERGHSITTLVRNPDKTSGFPPGVIKVRGAIEDIASQRQVLEGQDVFVNIAALVKMWVKDRSAFERTNVRAVEDAIRTACDAGIHKFIHTSSFIALGPSDGTPIAESDARRSDHFHNEYERTKYLGDQVARQFQDQGAPVTIVYPGVIYGPGNLTYGNIVAKNVIPFLNGRMPFGLALKAWSYVFIQDVVRGLIRIIEAEPPSRRYILGGDNKTGAEFYQALYEVTGKKPPVMNIPMGMAKVTGYMEYLLAVLFGREPSLLTHEVVEIYKHSWAYDSRLAKADLGYTITPLSEGLAQMVAWLKKEGHVRS